MAFEISVSTIVKYCQTKSLVRATSRDLIVRSYYINGMTLSIYIASKDQLKKVTILKNPGLQHLAENIFGNLNYQQINGAGISAGAANISINARARTTPARVCSAPPRSAALGWSLDPLCSFFGGQ